MLFKLSVFVPDPDLPVFKSLVLVCVMFRPATQPPSFTEMFADRFQCSKGTTKTNEIICIRLRGDNFKVVVKSVQGWC